MGAEDVVREYFNARTRAARRAAAKSDLERVADGVWLLRGGIPRSMNVYFLEDEGGGVTLFDAGIRQMTNAVATAAAPLGGINRVVLGHADVDHRGAAAGLGVPVFCHEADRPAADAFNQDTRQARESIRKLAALDPVACWPGHGDALTGDVRAQLERAAGA